MTVHDYELSEALSGTSNLEKVHLTENNNGFFFYHGKPINTKVSAVVFCSCLKLFGLDGTEISCWHHPMAINPLPRGIFPFDEYNYSIQLQRHKIGDQKPVVDILEIDKGACQTICLTQHQLPGALSDM